jgi:hypothetical protein
LVFYILLHKTKNIFIFHRSNQKFFWLITNNMSKILAIKPDLLFEILLKQPGKCILVYGFGDIIITTRFKSFFSVTT